MNYIKREIYLKKIRPFYQTDIIKVISGIRRCGKSTLMQQIKNELIEDYKVDINTILYIDLDSIEFSRVRTKEKLFSLLEDKLNQTKFDLIYVFIDEIQNIPLFEQVLTVFNNTKRISFFITGSNSYLLSGELVTKLTGRYIEFEIFTLSFNEYIELKKLNNLPINFNNINKELENYIYTGGFPKALEFSSTKASYLYTSSIVNEIFTKDIKMNNKLRNKENFNKILEYVINNFGSCFSLLSIYNYFNDVLKIKIKRSTIKTYIDILINAKLIYKCENFDLKSKHSLSRYEKYYLSDLSLYFYNKTDININYGPVLENLVYLELIKKDYKVSLIKTKKFECDFLIRKNINDYSYIQVSMSILDEKVYEREVKAFSFLKDNYPKYIFTLDNISINNNGYLNKNIVSFLLNDFEL